MRTHWPSTAHHSYGMIIIITWWSCDDHLSMLSPMVSANYFRWEQHWDHNSTFLITMIHDHHDHDYHDDHWSLLGHAYDINQFWIFRWRCLSAKATMIMTMIVMIKMMIMTIRMMIMEQRCLCSPMVSASYEWPRAQGTFPTLHSALTCTQLQIQIQIQIQIQVQIQIQIQIQMQRLYLIENGKKNAMDLQKRY